MNLRFSSPRAVLGLLLLVLMGLELHTIVTIVRAQARVRDRSLAAVRQSVALWRNRLATEGEMTWDTVLHSAIESGVAHAAEAHPPGEQKAFVAFPARIQVSHWPGPEEMERVRKGEVVSVGPLPGERAQILSYVLMSSGTQESLVRLASDADDLVEDLRARQAEFVGQVVVLLLLLAGGALVAMPSPAAAAEPVSHALEAYEEAMSRLRDHGEEASLHHERERKRLEGVMRDQEALARAGELTAGIVHEVRNGLGTILGYARLLERSPGAEEAEHGRNIREECETLETVIRRFMEYVKRETLRIAEFDLRRMLSRVAARESRAREGDAVVLAEGSFGTLPADEDLLERAFENLVRNAREAAGPRGRVEITLERTRDGVVVTVADDGPGLPPDVRAGLRPFFTTKSGGLGLGLAIALKIVRLHGGELELADRMPRGLTVRVRLPASHPGQLVTKGNDEASRKDANPPGSLLGNTMNSTK